jgi:hypothetical protein
MKQKIGSSTRSIWLSNAKDELIILRRRRREMHFILPQKAGRIRCETR